MNSAYRSRQSRDKSPQDGGEKALTSQKEKEHPLAGTLFFFAESGGFEPSIRLRVYRISSAALSTTQTTFLISACKGTAFF